MSYRTPPKWLGFVIALLLSASAMACPRDASVRRHFQSTHPCPANGHQRGACPGWVADHVVALCVGGRDAVANLQWQTVADAKAKDKWECRRKYRK